MDLKQAARFYDLLQVTHWTKEQIDEAPTLLCDQLLIVHHSTMRAAHMTDAEALDVRAGLQRSGEIEVVGPSPEELLAGFGF